MWSTERLLLVLGLALATTSGQAAEPPPTATPGVLRIALYRDFPPYSHEGSGSDVDLGDALARGLGLRAEFAWFKADEDMHDDLRNMVWKGHYLGTRVADVMLHVPVDPNLQQANPKVRIFGAYQREELALARKSEWRAASTGRFLEEFAQADGERIGVELHTPADGHLMHALGGRLRARVAHFGATAAAVAALQRGEVGAVLAPRGQLQAALGGDPRYVIETYRLPPPAVDRWTVGMAVKAEAHALQASLEAALATLIQNGTLARLMTHHRLTTTTATP
ncbi:MAG: transporter substrate-binding domain-containing protein [Betaproteobacteria bacterium]|nr:transporter substrate-binding domain-containing protein [Betaproteobacteria bacterium]